MASPIETPELESPDITTRTGLSILQIMWQRKSLVILGVMLGLVLGLLYYAQKQPIYQSQAQVLVVKKSGDTPIELGGGRGGDSRMVVMEDYIMTQLSVIKSTMNIRDTLRLPNIKDLKTFTSDSEPDRIYEIGQMLSVTRDNRESANTNIVNLSFKGPIPDDCKTILDGIIKCYQEFLDRTFKDQNKKNLDLIREAKDAVLTKFEQADKEYADWKARSPYLYLSRGQGSSPLIAERIGKLENLLSETKVRMQDMADQLSRVEKAYKEGGPEKGPVEAMRMIHALGVKLEGMQQSTQFDTMLFNLRLEKKQMLATLGPENPKVKEYDERIKEIERFSGRTPGTQTGTMNNPDDPQAYMTMMREEINVLATKIDTLKGMIEQEQRVAKDMNLHDVVEERLRNARDNSKKVLDTIVNQLDKLDMFQGYGGYTAHAIGPPTVARKVAPTAYTVFPLAGIGGLVAGLCLAYLAEISDKSFRTPAEIRRRLGIPVIGHIPFYGPDEKAAKLVASGEPVVDPMLCSHYRSNAIESEAFRSVRTALYFNTHGVGHQVIQVTSPNVSDGKTTLAANLAVSIAQSGKRTIMIDGDCRRPRIHKIFNVPADTGLATVIAGQTDLPSAIRPTAIPNLSVLPCGPRPANPAELLTSPRFKELLDIIRSQYEFVIIDTPPLLVVTDPCVVAPRADGVIMAIRVTKNGRPFAERAKEILGSLGANVLGVVVNGVGGAQGGGKYGYGYDQYGYGYGYTYRYSYTYADEYTDDKAASYYQTDTADETTAPDTPPAEEKK